MKPVFFSSKLAPRERRVYKAATFLFFALFFAFLWPVYPIFNHIRPLVFGMPASLFYLVLLVGIAFFSILALYRWEDRHGKLDELSESGGPVGGDLEPGEKRAPASRDGVPASIDPASRET